tara:strand:- start:107 stop:874 length:768 start_codon:yes stop_codon:yes gene_type:complete
MKKAILCAVAFTALMSSCAVSVSSVDTSCGKYVQPGFAENGISEDQIVILPVLGVSESESLRKPISDELTISLSQKFNIDGDKKVIGTREVISLLNEQGGASEYASAIRDYRLSGILPKEYLNAIQKSTNSRYALYSRIELDDLKNDSYKSLIKEVLVVAQIWDLENADVVWEGQGGYAYISTTTGYVTIDESQSSDKTIIRNVTDGLSEVIGTSGNDCKDKSVLIKEIQKAYNNVLIGVSVGSLLIAISPLLLY